ncbi:ABC transporter ATP-binding protein [Novibacillus thermophilus]|jgi:ABC-type multidrug transport system ATPase subunit|uniref:ABC transporter n=1 Tax=Novibacillus thermophilus TaxID=1471761 RepID=A0A1U9K5F0_9BACL|nr:ABC transporter ATP-binding protein [Novibacillus thermophilus]AQS55254.1 ABC transporter [Novibacillus thermophilus]
MGEGTVLQASRLTKSFRAQRIIQDLSLKIPEGSLYGFLGPNGAGKTTTMRMLVGLIPPDDGEVLFKGKSIRKWKSALFEHVGCLIDTPSYYPNLSAYENLAYIQKMVGKPLKEIDRVLHVTGIFKARDKKVKHFSLGMKQRLGLAMALLNDPEVLILDEPTNGLDPEGIHEIRYLLIDLCRQEGKTVFVSSHNLAEMEMMADHIALIDKGRLIYEGALGTLLMTEQYVLRVRQGEKAEQLLEAEGLEFCKEAPGAFLVEIEQEEVPRLLRLMISQRIDVLEMARKKQTLEELFLSLVRDE